MLNAYDIAWGSLLVGTAPIWLVLPKFRRKVLRALRERMGGDATQHCVERPRTPAVMIHAVSLGEMNAARALISRLASARPGLRFIISTTTDTGFARGRELYGTDSRVDLIRYPLDFSVAVKRVLDALAPSVVILMELEVWPNFVRECERRGIPVVLLNGRLTESSYRGYRRGGLIVRRMFRRLAAICAQDSRYAARFKALGAVPSRVQVTGTMKFDTAQIADEVAGAADLAREVGLVSSAGPILICGSTGPGEEEILLRRYCTLQLRIPMLRMVLVPRHPERFNAVADLIREQGFALVRRSESEVGVSLQTKPGKPTIVLGDTMGELRKFYSLADVVFVGRTLVDLGARQQGSDMIEPAALAKPVIVGPYTKNFAEPMEKLRGADAIREVGDEGEWARVAADLFSDKPAAAAMGRRAQEVVRREQGATDRHVELVLQFLDRSTSKFAPCIPSS